MVAIQLFNLTVQWQIQDFPLGGGGVDPPTWALFAKNVKMKELSPVAGGIHPAHPPRSANAVVRLYLCCFPSLALVSILLSITISSSPPMFLSSREKSFIYLSAISQARRMSVRLRNYLLFR